MWRFCHFEVALTLPVCWYLYHKCLIALWATSRAFTTSRFDWPMIVSASLAGLCLLSISLILPISNWSLNQIQNKKLQNVQNCNLSFCLFNAPSSHWFWGTLWLGISSFYVEMRRSKKQQPFHVILQRFVKIKKPIYEP